MRQIVLYFSLFKLPPINKTLGMRWERDEKESNSSSTHMNLEIILPLSMQHYLASLKSVPISFKEIDAFALED